MMALYVASTDRAVLPFEIKTTSLACCAVFLLGQLHKLRIPGEEASLAGKAPSFRVFGDAVRNDRVVDQLPRWSLTLLSKITYCSPDRVNGQGTTR